MNYYSLKKLEINKERSGHKRIWAKRWRQNRMQCTLSSVMYLYVTKKKKQ